MPTINAQGQKQYQADEILPPITPGVVTPPANLTPISGTPTQPFQTLNGVNYAATPIAASDIQSGPSGSPTVTTDTTHSTDLSTTAGSLTNGATDLTKIDPNASPVDQLKTVLGIEQQKGAFTEDLQKQQDIAGKQQAVANANKDILNASKSFDDEIKSIKTQVGLTPGQLAAKINNVTTRKAEAVANLGIVAKVAQGDLDAANSIIDQKVKAKFEPVDNYIKTLQVYKDFYSNDLTDKEKMDLQLKIDDAKKQKDANSEAYAATLKILRDNGAPASAYQAVDDAAKAPNATPASISSSAGTYAQGSLATGEYAPVINSVASLVGATKAGPVKQAITSALNNGDYTTAYANVANAVEDALTGTNKTKFADARTDIGVMKGLRDAIKAYTDAGGSTGFLKGKADDIAKKFGQLAVDPKFATLGTELQREFQAYRLAMTGAAFTPAESKDYESVNPSSGKTLDLNLAVIDGALNQLKNRVVSTIDTRVPGVSAIRDKIEAPTNAAGTTVMTGPDGKTWNVPNDKVATFKQNGYK